ncbi:flagellar biosynthesis protein FlhB [Massilia antarctica]|uniref:flagellar biosynthesis protein FlhB n=1 Tax=Massilia antarctica TaxID=2765360 RepID=UPI0006BB866F|nr:flagellar biosynthesis protein FlhB [Massilia sp. H27-R4]MCY0911355.1 flagellar biosynthesis protein FlhB [Massilia sp. H27-R4]CUI05042.1 Flagellar biosynthesis protein FlhB [Janthinobacterium sp. CG23_2]CUU28828.1 Flagellar biosynthesis protein FlhB [Janthinobacterium sp. CG23_2]
MSDESDAEKTESASAKRLEQAREEGDVPRSRELATFTVLMTAGSMLWFFGAGIVRQLNATMVSGLAMSREQIFDPNAMILRVASDIAQVMLACLPLAAAVMVVALASPLLIGGWLFSSKSFMPNFNKLNPIRGLSNMVSTNALVELLKALAKTIVVGTVAWMVVMSQKDAVIALAVEPLRSGSAHMVNLIGSAFLSIVGGLGIVAAIDGPYQIWHYANKLKMTRQEMIQESKESDGNPQIKGKIRQMQREMSQRRMMADVPTADVVVTNPTHYAVALKYGDGQRGAPRVVAKGSDEVAARIRELAKENNVAMLEAPALARALHKHTEIGDEIPEALYSAVAEVLAYVFQLRAYKKDGGTYPDRPTRLRVPPELDPHDPASHTKPEPKNGATP